MMAYFADDDVQGLLTGGESLIAQRAGIVETVTTREVSAAYKKNEIAADRRFAGKKVLISGQVQAIKSGIGGGGYLVMATSGGPSPQLHLPPSANEDMAALVQGQQVYVVCDGAGSTLGMPVFKSCAFVREVATKVLLELGNEIDQFFLGQKVSDKAASFAVLLLALATAVPDDAGCPTHFASCKAAVGQILDDDARLNRLLQEAVETLKAHGIVPPNQ